VNNDELRERMAHYGCGPVKLTGSDDALYERRLVFDHVVRPDEAGPREQFESIAGALRDILAQCWLKTSHSYDRANPKQVYYLSMEFLIGRSLSNNLLNLQLTPFAGEFEKEKGVSLAALAGRRAREWWAWPAGGLLHRFPCDTPDSGYRLRSTLRLRDFSTGDGKWISG
jgi:hypothetical protein